MCVIFFYANSNPTPGGYKLILASNRDEFFARETLGVAKWANAEHVYGGIDLEPGREGGTWLAIGGHGGVFKVGALLNLTGEPRHKDAVGRGMIVSDFVKSRDNCNIDDYNRQLVADCTKYSAFNFISIEIGSSTTSARITLCSNMPAGLQQYADGHCYGFGNSLPTAPFEKVRYGQQRFQSIVEEFNGPKSGISSTAAREQLVKQCKELLKCRQKFWPDAELLRRAPNWGEELSALNVNIPHADYGSRTHSIILVDDKNKLHFYEDTMAGMDPLFGEWNSTHIEKQYFED